ncbi:hypothetical protein PVAND_000205 [Polypedilum vanderplanki]|uniref:C2H2-type domain-containing protein n=1 Tax=Polypedilum vanderplanki TaxID=319348 RepID=A0A9J6BK69_POLVA|nr:hypothetical protein PVAND_000205 [Polypedilum vanderplanki]
MICFKCNKNKNNIEELKFHLKDKHNLKENDLYKCGFKECQQEFNKSSSFYRHLRTLHKSNEVESIQINKSNESNAFECSKSEIQDFSNDTSDTNLSSSFNEEQAFDDIKQSDNTNEFEEIFFHFLTTLHSNPSLTKKTIQQIFTNVKNQIIDRILNYANNSDLRRKIGISYSKYDSYYKYQKKVEEKGFLSKAKQEVISQKISPIYRKGKIVNDIIISNFIQGETWKKIRSEYKPEDTVIPCFLNHDDFEPDNPLGSNAGNNKIAAFYYTFPVIPHYLLSSPNFIFDGSLFSSHLKNEDLKSCVEPLVNIFVDLETNGIDLNMTTMRKSLYSALSFC